MSWFGRDFEVVEVLWRIAEGVMNRTEAKFPFQEVGGGMRPLPLLREWARDSGQGESCGSLGFWVCSCSSCGF